MTDGETRDDPVWDNDVDYCEVCGCESCDLRQCGHCALLACREHFVNGICPYCGWGADQ